MADEKQVELRNEPKSLAKQESIARDLKRAFPLPSSGSFGDLLSAIDEASKGSRR